mgnify:CR=1 FL=1
MQWHAAIKPQESVWNLVSDIEYSQNISSYQYQNNIQGSNVVKPKHNRMEYFQKGANST